MRNGVGKTTFELLAQYRKFHEADLAILSQFQLKRSYHKRQLLRSALALFYQVKFIFSRIKKDEIRK
jgi:hypothetical protein